MSNVTTANLTVPDAVASYVADIISANDEAWAMKLEGKF
eukprot:CAMPEP_0117064834 /NCGR_PEP_ID=MMETSP0472-20121206/45299_1 /TAXON_ID=693140 ORGANISM="Tiarina fusus, Strain LIS" /NCGR_SAMPLE_ID=MMETSP0472 /ASSEMBLY_ACC=CAM_ASM_000603 /LENGTH=38 /DNA_ID= /DNA_START= /DNA_END= /DNA_ORIENTATION=